MSGGARPRPASTGRAPGAVLCLALASCAPAPEPPAPAATAGAPVPEPIFRAGDALESPWRIFRIWREAEFEVVPAPDAPEVAVAIEARAEGASAGLARRVELDPARCGTVEWAWQVDTLPAEADLASRAAEDVAASVFFAFGDPGLFANPDPVPTLRYAWATETNPAGSVIDSPYFPGVIRTLVVRSGPEGLGTWVTERRDLVADYRTVFGEAPEADVEIVALFTDSDHGETAVTARYAWARALCTEPAEPPSIF